MTYTLHIAKGTIALAVHIALEEIGAPHDLHWVSFSAGAQRSEEYLSINPKGRVPTLITPHGALTETAAILTYLATVHPEAGLQPDDPFARARVDELSLYLASTVHVNHAHRMRGSRWSDDPACWPSMTAKVAANMAENFALIETRLGDGLWVLGDAYSTADIYLFAVARWLEGDGVAMAQFPHLTDHFTAMQDRPAVIRALAHHV